MKRLVIACLLVVGCAGSRQQPATTIDPVAPPPPLSEPIPEGWELVVDMDRPPTLPTIAQHDRILDRLVGPHVHGLEECKASGPKAIATLQGGVEGSFSGVGKKETAYLVTTRGCDDPADRDTDKHRFVVMAGDALVIDQEVAEHSLVAVSDVDADGDNEVVLVGGSRGDATGSVTARLVDMEGGQFAEVYGFGEVARTRCPAGAGSLMSSRILYRKQGTSMEYKNERRERPCPGK